MINDKELEQVEQFEYLESVLISGGKCSNEMRERVAMAKIAFKMRKDLQTKSLNIKLKLKMVIT